MSCPAWLLGLTTGALENLRHQVTGRRLEEVESVLRELRGAERQEANASKRAAERTLPPVTGKPFAVLRFTELPVSKNQLKVPVIVHRDTTPVATIKRTKAAREWEKYARETAAGQYLGQPVGGPVEVQLHAVLHNTRQVGGSGAKVLDLHNLEELLYDALEGVVYVNDRQVTDGSRRVRYVPEGLEECLVVTVRAVDAGLVGWTP